MKINAGLIWYQFQSGRNECPFYRYPEEQMTTSTKTGRRIFLKGSDISSSLSTNNKAIKDKAG
jgi:hypothetical protein